jgi:hypothetical protein
LELVVIGGKAGRLRGFCGNSPAAEIEATVVVDSRVYVFTLFSGVESGAIEADERALFDAFAATITLSPENAQVRPSVEPGPS